MILRPLIGFLALGLALPVLAACGGDDDTSDSSATTAPGTSSSATTVPTSGSGAANPTTASSQPSASGDAGSVTVDGDQIGINEVRRCEPFFDGENDLDLTGIGDGVMVFVNVNQPVSGSGLTMFEMSIQGANAGGVFSGTANSIGGTSWTGDNDEPLPGAPYERSGDRITGELKLSDARGGVETRTVAVDLEIPDEIIDCAVSPRDHGSKGLVGGCGTVFRRGACRTGSWRGQRETPQFLCFRRSPVMISRRQTFVWRCRPTRTSI